MTVSGQRLLVLRSLASRRDWSRQDSHYESHKECGQIETPAGSKRNDIRARKRRYRLDYLLVLLMMESTNSLRGGLARMRRRVLLLLTSAAVLIAAATVSIVLLLTSSANSERRTLGGPPIPGCGTAEERVASSDITLAEAQKLVDACLASYSPGSETSPTPGPSGDIVTYPLKEPTTIVLADGTKLDLPAGADFGYQLGMGGTIPSSSLMIPGCTSKPGLGSPHRTPGTLPLATGPPC